MPKKYPSTESHSDSVGLGGMPNPEPMIGGGDGVYWWAPFPWNHIGPQMEFWGLMDGKSGQWMLESPGRYGYYSTEIHIFSLLSNKGGIYLSLTAFDTQLVVPQSRIDLGHSSHWTTFSPSVLSP